ncbi:MAG: dienelactone hydrolase family protein [Armatimonadetes bacterium]|nr:dienelactone hydrolase family protein [Armatimonadota bacterium]
MSNLDCKYLDIPSADGSAVRAYMARPVGRGVLPVLLVLQEAFGVNAHIRQVAERFAAGLGYLAIAPELFHRTAPGIEGDYNDFTGVMEHVRALTEEGMSADFTGVYNWIRGQEAVDCEMVGAVGFCMGGRAAFLCNSVLPLKAAVSYYGGGIAPGLLGRAPAMQGPILLFWGGMDQHIGPEQRRAVSDALCDAGKKYVAVEFSDAQHGFFCDVRPSYNPDAAIQSWALTVEFFKAYLK